MALPTLRVFHQSQGWSFSFGHRGWLDVNVSPDGATWAGDAPVPDTGLSFGPGAVVWGGS
jgi:hypothetical protein